MQASTRLNLRASLAAVVLMTVTAAILFQTFQRQLTGVWFAVGVHPDVLASLETGQQAQRDLARFDPESEASYRQRFDETTTLLRRLRVLDHNRSSIAGRYQMILLGAFAGTVVLLTGASVAQKRRQEARLQRLGEALSDLAGGRTDIDLGDPRRDLIGRIAAMVERTSRVMAWDRRRLAALQNLSAWQDAARRHAHEMRTPLTGARLELGRLEGLLEDENLDHADDIRRASRSASQELERLGRFAASFTSFARLPHPRLEARDLRALIGEYVQTFEAAWSNLELVLEPAETGDDPEPMVEIDRDLLRQVLVNLCDNSSLALGENAGRVSFRIGSSPEGVRLEVSDDGPGIDPAIVPRLFEPYTTSRGIGEGMGLGLAISKKILLDHGGDLELVTPTATGATFRLTLARPGGAQETDP